MTNPKRTILERRIPKKGNSERGNLTNTKSGNKKALERNVGKDRSEKGQV